MQVGLVPLFQVLSTQAGVPGPSLGPVGSREATDEILVMLNKMKLE